MNCSCCLVEGRRTVPVPATTAWNGIPMCAECAASFTAERQRREAQSRGWTESTRTMLTA